VQEVCKDGTLDTLSPWLQNIVFKAVLEEVGTGGLLGGAFLCRTCKQPGLQFDCFKRMRVGRRAGDDPDTPAMSICSYCIACKTKVYVGCARDLTLPPT